MNDSPRTIFIISLSGDSSNHSSPISSSMFICWVKFGLIKHVASVTTLQCYLGPDSNMTCSLLFICVVQIK